MMTTQAFAPHLPYLRRYARALTGSQNSGDTYVRATLTALLAGERTVADGVSARLGLYQIFYAIWSSASGQIEVAFPRPIDAKRPSAPEERLAMLEEHKRAALLLTAVEGFSLEDAAFIMDETPEAVERAIDNAHNAIDRNLASRVLIIEDEALIALDLERLVTELGHEVVGIATTHSDAVALALAKRPGLVLADINLGEGGLGTDAVTEILNTYDIPVIFITAYAEKLLTGERREPTYLIAKPFASETVQATVSQALFFHQPVQKVA